MDNTPTAFIAPPGKVVYIGDFVYTRENHVVLRRDLAAFERARKQALPDLNGEVLLAETRVVERPLFFLVRSLRGRQHPRTRPRRSLDDN
ncbi:hypothetical protein [Massilia sp. CCM 8734]|uniref:hypothetical protein n=1 Tax=Massilia sp. CCM 8734 TaxID=2609283 RepID=UPI0014216A47|nr:hypothetical protein [Massilia sp. CCM 8734]NHZ98043.1 hypothetical protein [Massilia sp. CCM 8734]